MSLLGIVGGTGLARLEGLEIEREDAADTPWGEPSAPLIHGQLDGLRVVFLARHGREHTIAPHAVNYRANVWAMHAAGVRRIVAVNAVGGIAKSCDPGRLVIPHQLVDYSWGRANTFCEGPGQPLQHIDFTEPYSRELRALLLAAASRAGIEALDGGVYAVTQGPRLETAQEINRLDRDGCDIVGMTGMPEAALARELSIEYACCGVVVNWAAGRGEGIHRELERWVEHGMASARGLLRALAVELREP